MGSRQVLVLALIAAQVLIPAVLLVVRASDPSVGQLPFGWQMHTSSWGQDGP